ncbi:unnamed protein product, partial [Didymodactylos carnosus]
MYGVRRICEPYPVLFVRKSIKKHQIDKRIKERATNDLTSSSSNNDYARRTNYSLCTDSNHSSYYSMIPTISTIDSSETMPIKYVDSGFSETTTYDNDTTIASENILEHILYFEQMYYEQLKENITKYSRPLRRYLSQQQILDLFQNIEKISAITESLVRHCEKLLSNTESISISTVYKSWLNILNDSYRSYIHHFSQAYATLEKFQKKISNVLQ